MILTKVVYNQDYPDELSISSNFKTESSKSDKNTYTNDQATIENITTKKSTNEQATYEEFTTKQENNEKTTITDPKTENPSTQQPKIDISSTKYHITENATTEPVECK